MFEASWRPSWMLLFLNLHRKIFVRLQCAKILPIDWSPWLEINDRQAIVACVRHQFVYVLAKYGHVIGETATLRHSTVSLHQRARRWIFQQSGKFARIVKYGDGWPPLEKRLINIWNYRRRVVPHQTYRNASFSFWWMPYFSVTLTLGKLNFWHMNDGIFQYTLNRLRAPKMEKMWHEMKAEYQHVNDLCTRRHSPGTARTSSRCIASDYDGKKRVARQTRSCHICSSANAWR